MIKVIGKTSEWYIRMLSRCCQSFYYGLVSKVWNLFLCCQDVFVVAQHPVMNPRIAGSIQSQCNFSFSCCSKYMFLYEYWAVLSTKESVLSTAQLCWTRLWVNPYIPTSKLYHYDVIKWKYFPRYWPFLKGIHRSPVNSHHKGQWREALMFSLICACTNGWANRISAPIPKGVFFNFLVSICLRSVIFTAKHPIYDTTNPKT